MELTQIRRRDAADTMGWLLHTMNRMVLCQTMASLLDLAYEAMRDDLGYDRVGLLLADQTGTLLVEHVGTDERGRRTYPSPLVPINHEKALFRARRLDDPRLQAGGPGYIYVSGETNIIPPEYIHLADGVPPQQLIVALRRGERVLGVISVDNLLTKRTIHENDAPPLVAFANALAVAIQNAQLLEGRAQQIALLDTDLQRRVSELEWLRDVSRRVNAAQSLDETLDIVYDSIRQGLGYDRVGIQLLNYEEGWWQDLRGTDASGRKTCPVDRIVVDKDDIRWQSPDLVALLNGDDFHYAEDVYAITPPALRSMLDGQPTQNINVAFRSSDALIGIISVDNLITGRPIVPRDARPLIALANQVGTAIENARLREKERAERARLTLLLDSARMLNSTLDPAYVLQKLAGLLVSVLDAAGVSFCQLDAARRRCVYLARHHASDYQAQSGESVWHPDAYMLLEHVVQTCQPLYVSVDMPSSGESARAFLRRAGVEAALFVPVVVHEEPVGVLEVMWTEAVAAIQDTERLCLALAEQAALALHNARLYSDAADRAERDPLTGLLHHRAFMARLDAEIAAGTALAVFLIDVDNFKFFNDSHGHLTGDAVLNSVAALLRDVCRAEDVAVRYGGDEFALLLPHTTPVEAQRVADRLRQAVQRCPCQTPDGQALPLSISIGSAFYPLDAASRSELLAVADAAMYSTKRGRVPSRRTQNISFVEAAGGLRRRASDLLGDNPMSVLEGLIAAVDAKDRYTRVHSEDTVQLALMLAGALGLSQNEHRTLALAAMLHDIGKIAIPDHILRKPGVLTGEEVLLMQRHVAYSVTILRGVLSDDTVLRAVATHHERWDGSGYPAGLRGAEIPLLGRIVQLADAVSAMRLDRPYRRRRDWPDIIAELRALSGRHFDPGLVEPFIAAMQGDRQGMAS